LKLSTSTPEYFQEFKANLLKGIDNYSHLAEQFIEEQKELFLDELKTLKKEIESIPVLTAELCSESR